MKFLVISYSYLPHNSPRSLRWSTILQAWALLGHEVEVISGFPSEGEPRFELSGVKVFAATGLNRIRKRLNPAPTSKPRSTWQALLRYLYDKTWRRLQWPDYACLWIRPAFKIAKARIKNSPPDYLITVSHPFSGHIVGRLIKRRFPKIPWYVDIGDPFSFLDDVRVNNQFLYGALNQRTERMILNSAQGISVTTAATRNRYLEMAPELRGKIQIMPPLFRGRFEDYWSPRPLKAGGMQNWLFLGTLYPQIRSPQPMLEFFSNYLRKFPKDEIAIQLVGEYQHCLKQIGPYSEFFGKRLILTGPVSEIESRRLLTAADGLINIGNHSPLQLPSKVVEYAASGKRILNFLSIEDDSSRPFFSGHPAVWEIGPEEEGKEVMLAIHRGEPDFSAKREQIEKFMEPFAAAHIAKQYLNHIRSQP